MLKHSSVWFKQSRSSQEYSQSEDLVSLTILPNGMKVVWESACPHFPKLLILILYRHSPQAQKLQISEGEVHEDEPTDADTMEDSRAPSLSPNPHFCYWALGPQSQSSLWKLHPSFC